MLVQHLILLFIISACYRFEFVRGFVVTAQERADPLNFLESLTDESVRGHPALSDPLVD